MLTLYAISGVMGIAAILMSRDLLIESGLLVIVAGTLIYVFLTDPNSSSLNLKAVNAEALEKKQKKDS